MYDIKLLVLCCYSPGIKKKSVHFRQFIANKFMHQYIIIAGVASKYIYNASKI